MLGGRRRFRLAPLPGFLLLLGLLGAGLLGLLLPLGLRRGLAGRALGEFTPTGVFEDALRVLGHAVARQVLKGLRGAVVRRRGGCTARGRQRLGLGGRFDGELPTALQRAGARGLRRGVPAQERGVLAAQLREFHPLGAQFGVEAGADLA